MFNCRNNLTFKAFLPFYLEIRTGGGGPSDGIARNGGARGQGGKRARGRARFFLAFCPFSLYFFSLFAFYFKV